MKIVLAAPKDPDWNNYTDKYKEFFIDKVDMFLWAPDVPAREDYKQRKSFCYVNEELAHKVVQLKASSSLECCSDDIHDIIINLTAELSAAGSDISYSKFVETKGYAANSTWGIVAEFLDLLPKGEICEIYSLRNLREAVTEDFCMFTTVKI